MLKLHMMGLAGLAAAFLVASPGQLSAQDKMPVEEVERIVREYLMREPEIIYDAIQELQKRRAAEESARQRAMIAERADQIFNDPDDPVAGNPQGDVTLVEFFDYRCGYCRSMSAGLQALLEHDKNLRFVFKELPVLGPESTTAAKAALAASRQGRYPELHFKLMQARDLSLDAILALAEEVGLDRDRLAADMESDWVKAQLDETLSLAGALGIDGTPSFVIGDQLIPGATDIARLAQLVGEQRQARN